MSAQKRDLTRRLKAAESSNRQLRHELQDHRAGQRWVSPAPMHPSGAPDGPLDDVKGKHSSVCMP